MRHCGVSRNRHVESSGVSYSWAWVTLPHRPNPLLIHPHPCVQPHGSPVLSLDPQPGCCCLLWTLKVIFNFFLSCFLGILLIFSDSGCLFSWSLLDVNFLGALGDTMHRLLCLHVFLCCLSMALPFCPSQCTCVFHGRTDGTGTR